MSSGNSRQNSYLSAPIGTLFVKTALPIIFVMSMSGLLNVVDAIFLGIFVGPDAVSAVTVIFPFTMLLIAASTLVTSGMASLLARRLGAGDVAGAEEIFAAAHGLALTVATATMAGFGIAGHWVVMQAAAGDTTIAEMAYAYLAISIVASPLMFALSLHADALRNEGRAPMIAGLSLLVSLANIAFNYLAIVIWDLGVAGSAYGTAAAQFVALGMVFAFRLRGRTPLPLAALRKHRWLGAWRRMIALGAPQSLSFLGVALVSGTIILALQFSGAPAYAETTAAYGIVTRVFGLGFLPLLGMGQAMQAIVGNNLGAKAHDRAVAALRHSVLVAAIYCAISQLIMMLGAGTVGAAFVSDGAVVAEVARILPQMTLLYVFTGPILMLALYFQSLGDASRAAIFSLTRPFVLAPVAILGLVAILGEPGIWIAPPVADAVMLSVVLVSLWRGSASARRAPRLLPPEREIA